MSIDITDRKYDYMTPLIIGIIYQIFKHLSCSLSLIFIYKASSLGRKNVVNLLLAHNANVNMKNKFGNSALILGSEIIKIAF